jgi:cell division protein FtsL
MATRAVRRQSRAAPEVPRRPPLRVVPGTKRKKRGVSYVPVVVLVVLSVFGVAVLQAWVGQDGLKAASLERDVQREQERLTLLRAQVAQLSSPRRLRDEANKLGLVAPADPVYLKAPVGRQSTDVPPRDDGSFALHSP